MRMGLNYFYLCTRKRSPYHSCQRPEASTKIRYTRRLYFYNPVQEYPSVFQTLRVLFNKQAIQQPDWMAVEGLHPLIQMIRITT
ncbi:hypothetical protein DPPLL_12550 [Desulfofustis limnaeus]|uniref:Transposase n=1 Tax=Desulfofustis limnaeus TaxID=2740163 RepID=A0ABN6M3W7_9BACT|nr:hypothetical protein DPPLL_12550 [Desulfofustis limnaeus]